MKSIAEYKEIEFTICDNHNLYNAFGDGLKFLEIPHKAIK